MAKIPLSGPTAALAHFMGPITTTESEIVAMVRDVVVGIYKTNPLFLYEKGDMPDFLETDHYAPPKWPGQFATKDPNAKDPIFRENQNAISLLTRIEQTQIRVDESGAQEVRIAAERVDIPQEAINATRKSVRDALELLCPDEAMAPFLDSFLKEMWQHPAKRHVQVTEDIKKRFSNVLPYLVRYHVEERGPLCVIPYAIYEVFDAAPRAVDFCPMHPGRKNSSHIMSTHNEILHAYQHLQFPAVILGCLLWQTALALQTAAISSLAGDIRNRKKKPMLSPKPLERIKASCELMGRMFTAPPMIKSFPAAFLTYARSLSKSQPGNVLFEPAHVLPAIDTYRRAGVFRNVVQGPNGEERFINCAFAPTFIRWAAMPLSGSRFGAHGALAAYIFTVEQLIAKDPSWKALAGHVQHCFQHIVSHAPAELLEYYHVSKEAGFLDKAAGWRTALTSKWGSIKAALSRIKSPEA